MSYLQEGGMRIQNGNHNFCVKMASDTSYDSFSKTNKYIYIYIYIYNIIETKTKPHQLPMRGI